MSDHLTTINIKISVQIQQLVSALKAQIVTKGQEISEFMAKHEIEVRVGDRGGPKTTPNSDSNSVLVEN